MNPDAQAGLDTADMMLNDPDPEVRGAYLAAYAPPPRKDHPVPNGSSDFLMGEGADDPAVTKGPWFIASYPGECSGWGCGMPFMDGDTIRADGEGGWEAQECYEDCPGDHQ